MKNLNYNATDEERYWHEHMRLHNFIEKIIKFFKDISTGFIALLCIGCVISMFLGIIIVIFAFLNSDNTILNKFLLIGLPLILLLSYAFGHDLNKK